MKRQKSLISTLILFALLAAAVAMPVSAQAVYDRDVVISVMRANYQSLGLVKSALSRGDFYAAAEGFWKFAEGQNRIMKFTPPKGSKAEWDRILGEFVDTALRGVGAAGERDATKGLRIVAELEALNKAGHSSFR